MMFFDIHTHHVPLVDGKNNQVTVLNLFPKELSQMETWDATVYFSCGIHPWHIETDENEWRLLKTVLSNKRIVAVGEAGLDKFAAASMDIQTAIFREQILLSETVKKPMIIHNVRAWNKFFDLLEEVQPVQPWILHGYRGKPELTERLLKQGLYFSIGEHFNVESVKLIPLDKLFCETDESQVAIETVYHQLAQVKEVEMKTLATQIQQNVKKVFALMMNR